MTKQELIKRVASSQHGTTLNKKLVGELVDRVFAEIAEYFIDARVSAKKTPRFTYPGFGTFTKKRRPARGGRNPQTGEPIVIPETVTVAFVPGQELKAELNQKLPRRRRERG
jgi:nucleoid DNA-binding protein